MSDISPGQEVAAMWPLPEETPPRAKFSDDALAAIDAQTAGHSAAVDDRRLNGGDAADRYQEGLDE
jgi:hypothetical protein